MNKFIIIYSKDLVSKYRTDLAQLVDCDYDLDEHMRLIFRFITNSLPTNNINVYIEDHFKDHVYNYEEDKYVMMVAWENFIKSIYERIDKMIGYPPEVLVNYHYSFLDGEDVVLVSRHF